MLLYNIFLNYLDKLRKSYQILYIQLYKIVSYQYISIEVFEYISTKTYYMIFLFETCLIYV